MPGFLLLHLAAVAVADIYADDDDDVMTAMAMVLQQIAAIIFYQELGTALLVQAASVLAP